MYKFHNSYFVMFIKIVVFVILYILYIYIFIYFCLMYVIGPSNSPESRGGGREELQAFAAAGVRRCLAQQHSLGCAPSWWNIPPKRLQAKQQLINLLIAGVICWVPWGSGVIVGIIVFVKTFSKILCFFRKAVFTYIFQKPNT